MQFHGNEASIYKSLTWHVYVISVQTWGKEYNGAERDAYNMVYSIRTTG